jgi:hypothetical protein
MSNRTNNVNNNNNNVRRDAHGRGARGRGFVCQKKYICSCFVLLITAVLIMFGLSPYVLPEDRRPHVLLKEIGTYLERIDELEQDVREREKVIFCIV